MKHGLLFAKSTIFLLNQISQLCSPAACSKCSKVTEDLFSPEAAAAAAADPAAAAAEEAADEAAPADDKPLSLLSKQHMQGSMRPGQPHQCSPIAHDQADKDV